MKHDALNHIMIRHVNLTSNPLHLGGRLFQQFIVDMWAKIETNRLNYIALNQKKLRASTYKSLIDATENGDSIVGRKILPSSFTGGPRYMQGKFQDAMAVIKNVGQPHYFITMTCNPKWECITSNLLPGQTANDRPDIVARVFQDKLKVLVTTELKKAFGACKAVVYSIEFQKKGLVHAHILLTLLNPTNDVGNKVCAEIPCPVTQPDMHTLVMTHMIHKPCHLMHRGPCMIGTSKCTKNYPKPYRESFGRDANGFPLYQRRQNSITAQKYYSGTAYTITSANVVPYNPYLLARFNCHINVERCSNIGVVKYLFKYIFKGADRGIVSIQNNHDEIMQYKSGRYICPVEAAWRILKFDLHYNSHSVLRLPVHLPNEQNVTFEEDDDIEGLLDSQQDSKLTKFFELCRTDSACSTMLYPNIVLNYIWDKGAKRWKRRVNLRGKTVARIYTVSPIEGERYYLRMLLLKVRGPKSFKHLLTVNDQVYGTFKEACVAYGLLKDDDLTSKTLREVAAHQMPSALRHTFAGMLQFLEIQNPTLLWERFLPFLSEDFKNKYPEASDSTIESITAGEINEVLIMSGSSFAQFIPNVAIVNVQHEQTVQYISNVEQMNNDQMEIFEMVKGAVADSASDTKMFFVQAPGGCGKTFLFNGIAAHLLNNGYKVACVAASAIAASLLHDGNTAHAFFKIPLNAQQGDTCNISFNTQLAQKIRDLDLIIFDEAPMASKYAIEAVDHTLKDIMRTDEPMGGKVIVFGGDWRQTLPVVPGASRPEIVHACFKSSYLWKKVLLCNLNQNMRTQHTEWNHELLKIGNGIYPCTDTNEIELPKHCNEAQSRNELINNVFPNINEMFANANYHYDKLLYQKKLLEYLADRIIMTPTNAEAAKINDSIIQQLPGDHYLYSSADSILDGDAALFQPEVLHSLQPSGVPPHELCLKRYMPVILMRNLNKKVGLCNGTRLIVLELHPNHIKVRISNGKFKGNVHFLYRISCHASDRRCPFRLNRFQFPIFPGFCMTINKSQGQSLQIVGLDLMSPIFSHGQLYVALSRCCDPSKVYVHRGVAPCINPVHNIVFTEILNS